MTIVLDLHRHVAFSLLRPHVFFEAICQRRRCFQLYFHDCHDDILLPYYDGPPSSNELSVYGDIYGTALSTRVCLHLGLHMEVSGIVQDRLGHAETALESSPKKSSKSHVT